jgi:hypothetical protein
MPMSSEMDSIVHFFFQKNNLEETGLHQLEQFVNDFPYCAPAQLLLAKKYQQSGDPLFAEQACKTAIFFTNPHWLNDLLYPEETQAIAESPDKKADASDNNAIADETATLAAEETIPADENIDAIKEDEAVPPDSEENSVSVELTEEIIPLQPEEAAFQPAIPDDPGRNTIADEATVPADENVDAIKEDEAVSPDREENPVPVEALTEEQHPDLSAAQEVVHARLEEDTSFEPEMPSVKLRSILDNPAAPGQSSDSLIPIEPLHTVDYFASQGIKISADIEGQDRLSIRLRSFTDWLKTMKKIHPEKLESMDQGAQSAIQHIAEHSNEAKEVVTEAMAEVFAKQGLHHKAVEVYRKLSLLNPDKRVYFAAKISKLNDL